MDEETKKALAGLLPATSTFTVTFTPAAYDKVAELYRPIFILKPFAQYEVKEISKYLTRNSKDEMYLMRKIRGQIIDFSNMLDISTGEQMVYDGDKDAGMSEPQFNLLPSTIQSEIVVELLRISGMSAG
jgi:hypothetical protein